jgi:hypothetical protein
VAGKQDKVGSLLGSLFGGRGRAEIARRVWLNAALCWMMQSAVTPLVDNPFAVLSFLAAPAILTNASTVLALSTSNRLARASDRARAASAAIFAGKPGEPIAEYSRVDFQQAARRAQLLVQALRRFYFAAGSFAAGACFALLGAFAGYFQVPVAPLVAQLLTAGAAIAGVGSLVSGSLTLLAETRLALRGLDDLHAQITRWRAENAGT